MPISFDNINKAEAQILELQNQVGFDIKEFTVEVMVSKFKSQEIIIPDFQRKFIWKEDRQSKFIESVIAGIPIPFMFGADADGGDIEIIDGVQRITTLKNFLSNKLMLEKLELLDKLNGFKYDDITLPQQKRFKNKTIRMVVFSQSTSPIVKFELFARINTESAKLTPSEIRKGAFGGNFYNFIGECSNNSDFQAICPVPKNKALKGEYEELVLRFFAYTNGLNNYKGLPTMFLNTFLVNGNKNFVNTESQYREDFNMMISFVKKYFKNGFRKTEGANSTPRARFEALSVGVILALREHPDLLPRNFDWLTSKEFSEIVGSDAANNKSRLEGRINYVKEKLIG